MGWVSVRQGLHNQHCCTVAPRIWPSTLPPTPRRSSAPAHLAARAPEAAQPAAARGSASLDADCGRHRAPASHLGSARPAAAAAAAWRRRLAAPTRRCRCPAGSPPGSPGCCCCCHAGSFCCCVAGLTRCASPGLPGLPQPGVHSFPATHRAKEGSAKESVQKRRRSSRWHQWPQQRKLRAVATAAAGGGHGHGQRGNPAPVQEALQRHTLYSGGALAARHLNKQRCNPPARSRVPHLLAVVFTARQPGSLAAAYLTLPRAREGGTRELHSRGAREARGAFL